MPPDVHEREDFEAHARRAARGRGPVGEFWYFLTQSRKWWMAPIIALLLLVAVLLVVAGTSVAPLIYTLF